MKAIEPKKQFLASPQAAQFADALGQPVVRSAIETALQQFVMDQLPTGDLNAAAVAHTMLQGAKRYVEILLNLTEPAEAPHGEGGGTLQFQRAGKVAPSQRGILRPAAAKQP